MSLRANYPSFYPKTVGLKPFLALEFFLARSKNVTGEKTGHNID